MDQSTDHRTESPSEGKQADDFPEESWVKVRILPGDTPRAIRMRHWLKTGIRGYRIKVLKLDAVGPGNDTKTTPAAPKDAPSGQ